MLRSVTRALFAGWLWILLNSYANSKTKGIPATVNCPVVPCIWQAIPTLYYRRFLGTGGGSAIAG